MRKLKLFLFTGICFLACKKTPDPGPSGVLIGDVLNGGQAFQDTRDGNYYEYVTIAGLDWMTSNLKYGGTNGGGGTAVPGPSSWDQGNGASSAQVNENIVKYGYLYNSSAVTSTTTPLCPNGWHIPTLSEMNNLIQNLGGASVAGSKMKSTSYWPGPNANTNSSKLSFLPAGNVTTVYQYGYWYSYHNNFGYLSNTWVKNGSNLYLVGLTPADDVTTTQVQPDESAYYSCRCVRSSTSTGSSGSTGSTGSNTNYMTDNRDGKTYPIVTIGTQKWMAKNLEFTGIGTQVAYNNDNSNASTYGYLYTSDITSYPPPTGWHIPTQNDIDILINYLGGTSVAGGKLKSMSSLWGSSNVADNSSGFSFLPGGMYIPALLGFAGLNNNGLFGYTDTNGDWAAIQMQATDGTINSALVPSGTPAYFSIRYVKD